MELNKFMSQQAPPPQPEKEQPGAEKQAANFEDLPDQVIPQGQRNTTMSHMGLAFGMLFLCLHTNEVLVQTEYKDGVLNPHYVGGVRREICSLLHDINPCGQAAQLSAWEVWHPIRALLISLLVIAGSSAMGCLLFRRKDVK